MAQELIFVRHGQTVWNAAGRLQGRCDSPLTELGRQQAEAHLGWLQALRPEQIIASPLGRTVTTAQILAAGLGVEVELDARLEERCMGRFEGWTLDEVHAAIPGETASRLADPWHYRAPGGENYEDLLLRVEPLIEELLARPVQRIVVVSHGTLVRPLMGLLLGLEPQTQLRLRQPNGVAYQVRLGPDSPEILRWEGDQRAHGLLLDD